MIVMKFGGSSVESGSAIRRVAAIVEDHLSRNPVVVVSAMGKTTSRLLELAQEASRGHVYFATQHLAELRDYHFDQAAGAVSGEPLERLEASMQRHFRDLSTLLSEIAEEGRELTPALLDEIAAYGERISSEVMSRALESSGIPAVHVDARRAILTDDRFTQATPLYWETYARLRRMPELHSGRVAVMGGFIGATGRGVTTTLGRGGSDLTASLVGAGISAEEIQIWTDVDGMLTVDPRIGGDYYRVRSISYEEATEMARCGAKVLHPDSVMPAIRQHIPIVIRNSRNPANEGTRIVPGATGSGMVKSIACRQEVMVLEIRPDGAGQTEPDAAALEQLCDGKAGSPEWIGRQGRSAYLAVREDAIPDRARPPFEGCMEVRIHPGSAILTLVGDRVASTPGVCARVRNALKQIPAMVLDAPQSEHALVVVIAQSELAKAAAVLHREFFAQPDASLFASCRGAAVELREDSQAFETSAAVHATPKLRLVLQLGR